MKKKTRWNSTIGKDGGNFSTRRRDIQYTTFGNRTTNWINGGGDQNYKAKHRYGTSSLCVDGLQHCSRGNKCLKGYRILSFHFCHFTKILGIKSKV